MQVLSLRTSNLLETPSSRKIVACCSLLNYKKAHIREQMSGPEIS